MSVSENGVNPQRWRLAGAGLGCRLVLLSQPLPSDAKRGWKMLFQAPYRMTWGNATAYVFEKTAEALAAKNALEMHMAVMLVVAFMAHAASRLTSSLKSPGANIHEVLKRAEGAELQLNAIHLNAAMAAFDKRHRWQEVCHTAQRTAVGPACYALPMAFELPSPGTDDVLLQRSALPREFKLYGLPGTRGGELVLRPASSLQLCHVEADARCGELQQLHWLFGGKVGKRPASETGAMESLLLQRNDEGNAQASGVVKMGLKLPKRLANVRWDLVLSLFMEMFRGALFPDTWILLAMPRLIPSGLLKWLWFKIMDSVSYTLLVSSLGRAGQWQQVLHIFHRSEFPRAIVAHNTVMHSLVESSVWTLALSVYDQLQRRALAPLAELGGDPAEDHVKQQR
eukprot:s1704_g9.t1